MSSLELKPKVSHLHDVCINFDEDMPRTINSMKLIDNGPTNNRRSIKKPFGFVGPCCSSDNDEDNNSEDEEPAAKPIPREVLKKRAYAELQAKLLKMKQKQYK